MLKENQVPSRLNYNKSWFTSGPVERTTHIKVFFSLLQVNGSQWGSLKWSESVRFYKSDGNRFKTVTKIKRLFQDQWENAPAVSKNWFSRNVLKQVPRDVTPLPLKMESWYGKFFHGNWTLPTFIPICGWLIVSPWSVTLLGCRRWLLRYSNHFLYEDIGLLCHTPHSLHMQYRDPVRGGPRLPAPFEIWPFSPGSLNFFIGAPQNNYSCFLNLFLYLPAPSTFVNLLPELKSVLKNTIGVFLC